MRGEAVDAENGRGLFFSNPLTAFARNYVAVKRPADKVSINPNIVTMGEIDIRTRTM